MYVKFHLKSENYPDLENLLQIHEANIKDKMPDAQITFIDPVRRGDGVKVRIRCMKTKSYASPEFTGFVDFEKFIFFCTMFSPEELQEKNLRKLRFILRKVLPININFEEAALKPTPKV